MCAAGGTFLTVLVFKINPTNLDQMLFSKLITAREWDRVGWLVLRQRLSPPHLDYLWSQTLLGLPGEGKDPPSEDQ